MQLTLGLRDLDSRYCVDVIPVYAKKEMVPEVENVILNRVTRRSESLWV